MSPQGHSCKIQAIAPPGEREPLSPCKHSISLSRRAVRGIPRHLEALAVMPEHLRWGGNHKVGPQLGQPIPAAHSSSGKATMKKEVLWKRGKLLHWPLRKKPGPGQDSFTFKIILSLKWEQDPLWTPVCPYSSPSPHSLLFPFFDPTFLFSESFAHCKATQQTPELRCCSCRFGVMLKIGPVYSLGQLSLLQGCAGWIHLLVPVGLKHPLLPPASSSQPGCAQRHILAVPSCM